MRKRLPIPPRLTPGQVLTVATGGVPILGSLSERYTERGHVVAIVSVGSGEVALEQK